MTLQDLQYLALTLPGNQTITAPAGIPMGGFTDSTKGSTILKTAISLFLVISVTLALLYLIWGGVQWIMSQGDKQKVQAARNRITYAVIGLFIMFLAFFIVGIIGAVFHLKLIGT